MVGQRLSASRLSSPNRRTQPMTTAIADTAALPTTDELRHLAKESLRKCGVDVDALLSADASSITARTPVTGEDLFTVRAADSTDVGRAIDAAHEAFLQWRVVPG